MCEDRSQCGAIKQGYQKMVNEIKAHLRWLSESVAAHNGQLEGLIRAQVKSRKEKLLADAKMTRPIGLPMKKREGAPEFAK